MRRVWYLGLLLSALVAFAFSGCDNEKVENTWDRAKKVHKVVKGIGKAVIETGVISAETAEALQDANSKIEGVGGAARKSWLDITESKKKDAK